jgi:hypothetical protein
MSTSSRIIESILNPPPPLADGAYSGLYYAFYGDGGFSVDQSFNPITLSSVPPVPINGNYAFYGQGGFTVDQSFNPILLGPPVPTTSTFQLYDVTYAVQTKFDVRTFNEKIGLIKDASNIGILDTSYNQSMSHFPMDSISISASEFVQGMSASQIISVGQYQTLYSEYLQSVNKYFLKLPTVNNSLFSNSSANDISGGIFGPNQFMSLINVPADNSQNSITGFITLSNINQLLSYAVNKNVFGNRVHSGSVNTDVSYNIVYTPGTVIDPITGEITETEVDTTTNIVTITITDPSNNTKTVITDNFNTRKEKIVTTNSANKSTTTTGIFQPTVTPTYADVSFSTVPGNYNVADGFLAGDLIFIPSGLSVMLQLVASPMIDASTSSIIDLIVNSGLAYEYAIDVNSISTTQTTLINKILSAPLLIELANLS